MGEGEDPIWEDHQKEGEEGLHLGEERLFSYNREWKGGEYPKDHQQVGEHPSRHRERVEGHQRGRGVDRRREGAHLC